MTVDLSEWGNVWAGGCLTLLTLQFLLDTSWAGFVPGQSMNQCLTAIQGKAKKTQNFFLLFNVTVQLY